MAGVCHAGSGVVGCGAMLKGGGAAPEFPCSLAGPSRSTFMPILLPVVFLLLQGAVLVFLPHLSGPASYGFMVAAPLLAAFAAAWRGARSTSPARGAWWALAAALAIWALGAFGNLWQELILGHSGEMYRGSSLAFNLAAVPMAFLLASDWRLEGRRLVQAIDGLLAIALGYGYFLLTWSMLTTSASADVAGVSTMVSLEDTENVCIAAWAVVRWRAAADTTERDFFRALASYTLVYGALIAVNNHWIAADPAFGPQASMIIVLAFALLAALALRGPAAAPTDLEPPPRLARAVRAASSTLLAGALLIVSLFLIRVDYPAGTAGILIAVAGHALRNTVAQMRHIERGDKLQRERSKLRSIAWTDALTGVPNRHYLDRILLRGTALRERRADQPLTVLMIDVDHFKRLNDHYGHPAGDACLRAVAKVLQATLVRPGDVLARYGGEEFIALVRSADAAGGLVVAERLRAAVEGLGIEHRGSPFGIVTVSIGVASATPGAEAAPASLIQAADNALYEAKCAGRNQVRQLPRVDA